MSKEMAKIECQQIIFKYRFQSQSPSMYASNQSPYNQSSYQRSSVSHQSPNLLTPASHRHSPAPVQPGQNYSPSTFQSLNHSRSQSPAAIQTFQNYSNPQSFTLQHSLSQSHSHPQQGQASFQTSHELSLPTSSSGQALHVQIPAVSQSMTQQSPAYSPLQFNDSATPSPSYPRQSLVEELQSNGAPNEVGWKKIDHLQSQ